jgi:hypothetical protein
VVSPPATLLCGFEAEVGRCNTIPMFRLPLPSRLGPTDPADPDGINSAADLPHLIRLRFINEQFHQGAGVTEEDHQLIPDP